MVPRLLLLSLLLLQLFSLGINGFQSAVAFTRPRVLPALRSAMDDWTVASLQDAIRASDPPRGTLSRLKRKQDLIEYLTNLQAEEEESDEGTEAVADAAAVDTVDDDDDAEDDDIVSSARMEEARDETEEEKESNSNNAEVELSAPSTFGVFNLSPRVQMNRELYTDWKIPTPIQAMAIPYLSSNNMNVDDDDAATAVWLEAPTGSGKTAAYVLPLLSHLLRLHKQGATPRLVDALILSPTRELTVQIARVVEQLCGPPTSSRRRNNSNTPRLPVRVTAVYGGVSLEDQIQSLTGQNAAAPDEFHVVVATPGRLGDLLTRYESNEAAADAELEQQILQAMEQQTGGNSDQDITLDWEDIQAATKNSAVEERASLPRLLEHLQVLVVDEADRLLGRAFDEEMNLIVDLMQPMNDDDESSVPSSQPPPVWMVSATFPRSIEPRIPPFLQRLYPKSSSPPALKRLTCANSDRLQLHNSEEMSASLQKKLSRHAPVTTDEVRHTGPASTIQLRTIRIEKPDRTQALRHLLKEHPEWDRVLVFVATRYAAEHVSRKLRRQDNVRAAEWHGQLDQAARLRRVEDLRTGKLRVLVATDVASRGMDLERLPAVINYDLPRSTVDFVHRIGRVGRAGQPGTAVSFCLASSEAHLDLIEQRHLAEPVPREVLPKFAPDEVQWDIQARASRMGSVVDASSNNNNGNNNNNRHSPQGLAHDRMYGGVKGHRKSKKDRLREAAAAAASAQQ